MEGDVESAKAMMESFEESSPEKKLKFYRDMTFYSHNLVECLREKVIFFLLWNSGVHLAKVGKVQFASMTEISRINSVCSCVTDKVFNNMI